MNDPWVAWASRLSAVLMLIFLFAASAGGADGKPVLAAPPAGLAAEEALRLGEAMYHKGTLPSGEPMTGYVQGDIEVSGRILTCANCHMRSGLGSYEGGVTTLPTNGAKLYSPLKNGYDLPSTSMGLRPLTAPRPAYSDQALAAALVDGVDPAGRTMSETMPRYILADRDMEIMIFYLKNLSSTFSPGATQDVLRLATVVSEGVSDEDRKSMVDPLMSFAKRFPRKLPLDVWELRGPRDTWPEQLEKQYREQPVFALLGGLVKGSWRPIHEFCEKNKVPAILPLTDLPVVSETGWYTLYFSKGYYQEGEAAAKYLAHDLELAPDRRIVQVSRDGEEAAALALGFADTWKKSGHPPMVNRTLAEGETTGGEFWRKLAAMHPAAVFLLWLEPNDLAGIELLGELPEQPSMVFVSSTMLGEYWPAIPDNIRKFSYITYPYGLPPEAREAPRTQVEQFWRLRNVHPPNKAIAEKVFSGVFLFSQAFGGLKNNRYRDYFLDLFDMLEDQTGYGVRYPRLSFGPGQRYASKGCYIAMLSEGPEPKLIGKSEWIIY